MNESDQGQSLLPAPPTRIKRPNRRQKKFIEAYLDPTTDTFGNTYQSAIRAGFSDSTARVLTANSRNTPWITDFKRLLTTLEPEHIYIGMQQIALTGKQDRDRLRALELLAKVQGMFVDRTTTEVSVTFKNEVPRPTYDISPTEVKQVSN